MGRTKHFPFRVKFLHHDFFKDFNHICNLDSIRSGRKAGYPTVTDLTCILYTSDITILSKLNHTNELYTPVPKDRNQPVGMYWRRDMGRIQALRELKRRNISFSTLWKPWCQHLWQHVNVSQTNKFISNVMYDLKGTERMKAYV